MLQFKRIYVRRYSDVVAYADARKDRYPTKARVDFISRVVFRRSPSSNVKRGEVQGFAP